MTSIAGPPPKLPALIGLALGVLPAPVLCMSDLSLAPFIIVNAVTCPVLGLWASLRIQKTRFNREMSWFGALPFRFNLDDYVELLSLKMMGTSVALEVTFNAEPDTYREAVAPSQLRTIGSVDQLSPNQFVISSKSLRTGRLVEDTVATGTGLGIGSSETGIGVHKDPSTPLRRQQFEWSGETKRPMTEQEWRKWERSHDAFGAVQRRFDNASLHRWVKRAVTVLVDLHQTSPIESVLVR